MQIVRDAAILRNVMPGDENRWWCCVNHSVDYVASCDLGSGHWTCAIRLLRISKRLIGPARMLFRCSSTSTFDGPPFKSCREAASKASLPCRSWWLYDNNVSHKCPPLDVEVLLGQWALQSERSQTCATLACHSRIVLVALCPCIVNTQIWASDRLKVALTTKIVPCAQQTPT